MILPYSGRKFEFISFFFNLIAMHVQLIGSSLSKNYRNNKKQEFLISGPFMAWYTCGFTQCWWLYLHSVAM